jgi:hypothetical protein
LAEKAEQVHKAVRLLCDSAAAGGLKRAGVHTGTPIERVEMQKNPQTVEELESMSRRIRTAVALLVRTTKSSLGAMSPCWWTLPVVTTLPECGASSATAADAGGDG